MSTEVVVAEVLERSGVGWLLREHRDARLKQIEAEIAEVSREIAKQLDSGVDLLQEMSQETSSLKPLVQLFALPTSTEMRVMVYCVLRGMKIKSIDFSYRLENDISLSVVLTDHSSVKDLRFTSRSPWDAEILRHLGIMTAHGKPVLHGFYAFQ